MTFIGDACEGRQRVWKKETSTLTCKPEEELDGALCYEPCNAGYDGVGPVCWGTCPAGTTECGWLCLSSGSCTEYVMDTVAAVGELAAGIGKTAAGDIAVDEIISGSVNVAE